MSHIVKAREVAQFLRLSEATVFKLLGEGQLPGFKIGDSWRLDMDEVMEHIETAKVVVKQKQAENNATGRGAKKTCRKN